MEILVCVKRVPTVGGKIAVTPDGQEVDTRASGFSISPHEECAVEEAVQITERDGRHGVGADPGTRGGDRATARRPRARRRPGGAAGDGRPGVRPDRDRGRHRRRGPGASGTTWCCSATRRPTPATTRSASGSRTSSAGRWPPGSRTCRCPRTAWSPAGSTAAWRRPTPCRCPRWSPSRRASTCRATRRCPGGCGPSAPRSSALRPPSRPKDCARKRSGCPRRAKHQAAVLGHGADAVPELVRVLDELGVLS